MVTLRHTLTSRGGTDGPTHDTNASTRKQARKHNASKHLQHGSIISKNIPQDGAALAPSTARRSRAHLGAEGRVENEHTGVDSEEASLRASKGEEAEEQKLAHRKSQMLDLFTSFLFHRYVQDMDTNDIEFLETEQWQEDDALLDSLSASPELKQEVKKRYAQFEDARQSLEIFMALNKANDVEQDWDPDVAQQNTLCFGKTF